METTLRAIANRMNEDIRKANLEGAYLDLLPCGMFLLIAITSPYRVIVIICSFLVGAGLLATLQEIEKWRR